MAIRTVTIFECDACGFRRDEESTSQVSGTSDMSTITFYAGSEDPRQRPVQVMVCAGCVEKARSALVSALGPVVEARFARAARRSKPGISK